MRSAPEILNVIEAAELRSADAFLIYRPTWNLIISALNWSLGKTDEEIMTRRGKCRYKQDQAKNQQMKNHWQLIIESLDWVLEETETNPIEARKGLIPFA